MLKPPIGISNQQGRPISSTRAIYCILHSSCHQIHIVPIHILAGKRVRQRIVHYIPLRLTFSQGGINGIKIIFDEEYDRQLVQARKIEALVKHALFGSAVPKKCDAHRVLAALLKCHRGPYRDRNCTRDNRHTCQHPSSIVKKVHGSASAATTPSGASINLCDHGLQVPVLGQIMAMRSVITNNHILSAERRARPDSCSLLPNG